MSAVRIAVTRAVLAALIAVAAGFAVPATVSFVHAQTAATPDGMSGGVIRDDVLDPAVRSGPLPVHYEASSRFARTLYDVGSGGLQLRFVDALVPANAGLMTVIRAYRSGLDRVGIFGRGWTSNLDIALNRVPGTGDVEIVEADGGVTRYHATGGGFAVIPGAFGGAGLQHAGDGFERRWLDGTVETFDKRGRLVKRTFGGASMTVAYASAIGTLPVALRSGALLLKIAYAGALVSEIDDPLGRATKYTYTSRRLTETTDALNRSVDFTYDGNDRLANVALPNRTALAIGYGADGALLAVTGPGNVRTTFAQSLLADGVTLQTSITDGENRTTRVTMTPSIVNGRAGFAMAETSGAHSAFRAFAFDGGATVNDPQTAPAPPGPDVSATLGEDWRAFVGPNAAPQNDPHVRYDAAGRPAAFVLDDGRTERWTWDAGDRLTRWVDAAGGVTTYAYDAENHLTSIAHPDGGSTSLDYDANDQLVHSKDPAGQEQRFAYDRAGLLAAVTLPSGAIVRLNYDPSGRFIGMSEAKKPPSAVRYDASGRLAGLGGPSGMQLQLAFDGSSRLASFTDIFDGTTAFTYAPDGGIATMRTPDGTTSTYASTGGGAHEDRRLLDGLTTSFDLDASGRDATWRLPGGPTYSASFSDSGNLERLTGTNGTKRTYAYDKGDRLVASDDGLRKRTFGYDAAGRLTGLDDGTHVLAVAYAPDGTSTQTWRFGPPADKAPTLVVRYDADGRVTGQTDPGGNTTNYTYTPLGLRDAVSGPHGTLKYAYDGGRLTSITYGNGSATAVTAYGYDAAGRLATIAHPDGTSDRLLYDDLDRVVRRVDRLGNTISIRYDGSGRPVGGSDPYGDWSVTLDASSRVVSRNDPLTGTMRYAYDDAGHRVTSTDPAGAATAVTYDAGQRPLMLVDALGGKQQWRYDEGRLTAFVDTLGNTTSLDVDPFGRETARHAPSGKTWKSTFNADGDVLARSAPNGSGVSYVTDVLGRVTERHVDGTLDRTLGYDTSSRVTTVTWPAPAPSATPLTETFAYDQLDRMSAETDAFGYQTATAYDAAGRLTSLKVGDADPFTYRYDTHGLLQAVTSANGTVSYAYDAAGRVVRTQYPSGLTAAYTYDRGPRVRSIEYRTRAGTLVDREAYVYDSRGNTRERTSFGRTTTYTYDALDRLVAAAAGDGTRESYTYDAAGDVIAAGAVKATYDQDQQVTSVDGHAVESDGAGNVTHLDGGPHLHFDGTTRLTQATDASGTNVTFAYDLLDRVVERRTGSGASRYTYFGLSRTAEYDAGGTRRALYVPSGIDGRWTAVVAGGATYEAIRDAQGTLLAVVDGNGRIAHRFAYDSYGRVLTEGGNAPVEPEFAGVPVDRQLGLVRFGVRYYSPQLRRFVNPDPAGPDRDGNVYGYALENPLRYTDLTGTSSRVPIPYVKQQIISALADTATTSPSSYQRTIADRILSQMRSDGSGFDFNVFTGKQGGAYGGVPYGAGPFTENANINYIPHTQPIANASTMDQLLDTLAHEHTHWETALSKAEYRQDGIVDEFVANVRGAVMQPYNKDGTLKTADTILEDLLNNPNYKKIGGVVSDKLLDDANQVLGTNARELGLIPEAVAGVPGLDPFAKGTNAIEKAFASGGLEATQAESLLASVLSKEGVAVAGQVVHVGSKLLPFVPSAYHFVTGVYNHDPDAILNGFTDLAYTIPGVGEAKMVLDATMWAGGQLGQAAANIYIAARKRSDAFWQAFTDLNNQLAAQEDEQTQQLRKKKRRSAGWGTPGQPQPMNVAYWGPPPAAPPGVPGVPAPAPAPGTKPPGTKPPGTKPAAPNQPGGTLRTAFPQPPGTNVPRGGARGGTRRSATDTAVDDGLGPDPNENPPSPPPASGPPPAQNAPQAPVNNRGMVGAIENIDRQIAGAGGGSADVPPPPPAPKTDAPPPPPGNDPTDTLSGPDPTDGLPPPPVPKTPRPPAPALTAKPAPPPSPVPPPAVSPSAVSPSAAPPSPESATPAPQSTPTPEPGYLDRLSKWWNSTPAPTPPAIEPPPAPRPQSTSNCNGIIDCLKSIFDGRRG